MLRSLGGEGCGKEEGASGSNRGLQEERALRNIVKYCEKTTILIFHNIVHRRSRKIAVFSKSTIAPQ